MGTQMRITAKPSWLREWAAGLFANDRARHAVGFALSDRAYPLVLASALLLIGLKFVLEFKHFDMQTLYVEYLANYDLGFIRRGLVPQLLSFAWPRPTHLDIKIFVSLVLFVTFVAYLLMFACRFGLNRRELPLLACTIASPAVFKTFVDPFGHLDMFGFLGATIALLVPVNGLYSLTLGAMCCLLILIHEAQAVTYVPVIVAIAGVRLLATPGDVLRPIPWREAAAVALIVAAFILMIRFGNASVPPDVFFSHLKAKAVDSIVDRVFIWYSDPWQNMQAASAPYYLWQQFYAIPRYALIAVVHLPLLSLLVTQTRNQSRNVRIARTLGILAITAGFVLMVIISHDRARWFANWLAGLILLCHALRLACPQGDPGLVNLRSPIALLAAWAMTGIARIGLMTPM
jgi:hypothetical protein